MLVLDVDSLCIFQSVNMVPNSVVRGAILARDGFTEERV